MTLCIKRQLYLLVQFRSIFCPISYFTRKEGFILKVPRIRLLRDCDRVVVLVHFCSGIGLYVWRHSSCHENLPFMKCFIASALTEDVAEVH